MEVWSQVQKRLRTEVGEAAFRSWLKPVTLAGSRRDGIVRLAVPSRFDRDWIQSNYAAQIHALWRAEDDSVTGIEIVVRPPDGPQDKEPPPRTVASKAKQAPQRSAAGASAAVGASKARTAGNQSGDVPSDAGLYRDRGELSESLASLDPRFTFDQFVVGKPNELAYAAARRVAEASYVPFNPLFLYGGVGLGKTHLMHAIAWHITRSTPQRKVLYLSAETFMFQFVRAVRIKDTVAFKELFRSVDVLMIDDVQFIGGREATQEEFFHTFNALVDQNRQVVISADKSPSDLEGVEERLRSRLGWGMVADIHPTTYELRLGILQAKAEQLGDVIPAKVLEFLAHKIVSNVRELEGALNRIMAHADLVGEPITLEGTQEVLRDLLRANDRRVTIEEIQKRVAEHFNVRIADMHSSRRARAVARPRQVAMYLSKQLTTPLAAGDRAQVRRPRPHHGHARGQEGRGVEVPRCELRGGRRALAPHAGELKPTQAPEVPAARQQF